MTQRRWIGIVLIIIAGFIILGNLGILERSFWELLATYWPVLLILAGVYNLVTNPAGKFGGFIVLIVGALLLVHNLESVALFQHISFWPVILILVGLWFLFRGGDRPAVVDKDSINTVALFSGASSKVVSQDFKGGSSVTMFGGAEIDLREARMSGSEAKFDIFAMFGGADLYIPEDWQVIIKGLPLFGGLDNKTSSSPPESGEEQPTLIINYLALFGGVDVKN